MEKEYYYTSTGRKVGDFFIGLIGTFLIQSFAGFLTIFVSQILLGSSIGIVTFVGTIIGAIYIMKKSNRRFIGIGLLIGILIPVILGLLLFGACLIIMPFEI